MTYCIDFFKKFKKEGNFCDLDPGQVSRLNAYLEIVELLVKQKIPENQVYENFTLGAATPLIAAKGEAHTEGLNFVTSRLKEGKKVQQKDVQSTLKSCKFTTLQTERKPKLPVEPEPKKEPVVLHPEIKKQDPSKCFSPQPGTIEVTDAPIQPSLTEQQKAKDDPPKQKPAPCLSGGKCPDGFNHIVQDKMQGATCFLWKQSLKQLPGDECYLDAKKRRVDDGMGNTILKPSPIKVSPVQFGKEAAEDLLIQWVRGYLTNKDREALGRILSTGEFGKTYNEIFTGLIWYAVEQIGGA